MRTLIIGLSIVFFLLSATALYKALLEPSNLVLTGPSIIEAPPGTTKVSPIQKIEKNIVKEETNIATESIPTNKGFYSEPNTQSVETPDVEKDVESKPIPVVENPNREVNKPYGVLAIFGGLVFRSGEDKVNDIDNLEIEKLINEIALYPNTLISIEGHSDNLPVVKLHKNNVNLSIRRARAIANLLVERGIARDRISVIGYGDTRPIDSNDTEEGRSKNRRVEVRLIDKNQGGN